jgi:hypothetical protein
MVPHQLFASPQSCQNILGKRGTIDHSGTQDWKLMNDLLQNLQWKVSYKSREISMHLHVAQLKNTTVGITFNMLMEELTRNVFLASLF